MQNLLKSLVSFLLASTLIVSLTACSTNSGSFVSSPAVSIPDLPKSVRYTDPKLPAKAAKDAGDTAKVLETYEKANESNRRAIRAAQKHNKDLQFIHNPKPQTATSSWFPSWELPKPKWPSNF